MSRNFFPPKMDCSRELHGNKHLVNFDVMWLKVKNVGMLWTFFKACRWNITWFYFIFEMKHSEFFQPNSGKRFECVPPWNCWDLPSTGVDGFSPRPDVGIFDDFLMFFSFHVSWLKWHIFCLIIVKVIFFFTSKVGTCIISIKAYYKFLEQVFE